MWHFNAVVAGFYLAIALGFGESIWEPLATMAAAISAMALLGLLRTGGELEHRSGEPLPGVDSAA